MTKKSEKSQSKSSVPTRTPHEELAREAREWETGARSPKGYSDAPEAIPRVGESEAISLRMPKTLLELLRRFAKREGIGYQVLIKQWLDDRLRVERDRMRAPKPGTKANVTWSIKPSKTSPILDADGHRAAAFVHVSVQNLAAFTPRVRGWVTFRNERGQEVGAGEMPIRWSSRPEPLALFPIQTSPTTVELRWLPDPALFADGYVTDFAEREEQEFAFAIKMRDGTCWGWTQESYLHGWRHPKWQLPSGRLQAQVRILAGGQERCATFELDTEESVDAIVVRGDAGHVGFQGTVAEAHLPDERLLAKVIPLRR